MNLIKYENNSRFNYFFEHKKSKILFFLSFTILFLFWHFKVPSLGYKAEVWAEAGTNFFWSADNFSILENLNTPDAGYFPFLQRFIALIIVKFLGLKLQYPFLIQFISNCIIAFCSSIICLRFFENIIKQVYMRFLIGISIGLIPDYELHTFINFPYYGIIPLVLTLFIEKNKLSKKTYVSLLVLIFFMILSKGVFVIFIPVYLILVFTNKKNKSEFFFNLIILLAIIIQLIFIINHKINNIQPNDSIITIFDKSFYLFWLNILSTFYISDILISIQTPYIFKIFFYSTLIYFIHNFFEIIQNKTNRIYFILIYISISSIALGIITGFSSQLDGYESSWSNIYKISLTRWTIFTRITIVLGFIHWSTKYFIKKSYITILFSILICFNLSLNNILSPREIQFTGPDFKNVSNWYNYKQLLNKNDYYIPINPTIHWAIAKNNVLLNDSTLVFKSKNKIRGIIIDNPPKNLSYLTVVNHDNKICFCKKLDPLNHTITYFYFNEPVNIKNYEFKNIRNKIISIPKKSLYLVLKTN